MHSFQTSTPPTTASHVASVRLELKCYASDLVPFRDKHRSLILHNIASVRAMELGNLKQPVT